MLVLPVVGHADPLVDSRISDAGGMISPLDTSRQGPGEFRIRHHGREAEPRAAPPLQRAPPGAARRIPAEEVDRRARRGGRGPARPGRARRAGAPVRGVAVPGPRPGRGGVAGRVPSGRGREDGSGRSTASCATCSWRPAPRGRPPAAHRCSPSPSCWSGTSGGRSGNCSRPARRPSPPPTSPTSAASWSGASSWPARARSAPPATEGPDDRPDATLLGVAARRRRSGRRPRS